MKKSKAILYWIIAILPFVVTTAFMPFLDEKVPTHYDVEGNIDAWGSKYVYYEVAAVMFSVSIVFFVMILYYGKKGKGEDKKAAGLRSNAKVLYYIMVATSLFESVVIGFILYSVYLECGNGSTKEEIDIYKVLVICSGVLFMALGNYMPKTKNNSLVGLRTGWSQKNDKTWAVSNKFGGIVTVISGIICIVCGVILSGMACILSLLVIISVVVVVSTIYSYVAYQKYGGEQVDE